MNPQLSVNDNEFLRQFESEIEGELAKIEYSQQDRKIFLTKLEMSDSLKEKGYLEPFIESVLDLIKEREIRVMPTSPAVAKFMRKHRRKYKDMLPVGINI
ncbi:N-acetyltransferase [Salinimicrobium oceani]|uniref:N-acetyltransferase n=1 Tax=Salinimicrobium oceani TaxID=2722702 RepID=A0ABX1CWW6_9FLAO|nr:N-acetyltransferase [Salinimicrobium oceani]NJW52775.1 N-acetyltransferase [Salinimicrobium oceani]